MPWKVERGHGCPDDKPWAVVKETTGEKVACHATKEKAQAQQRLLYAQENKVETHMDLVKINGERFEVDIPLVKYKEATGEFEGWATVEELDRSGEIIDLDKSWPYFEKWSQKFAKATDGESYGNVREQHDAKRAVGKLTAISREIHDTGAAGIYVKGVIVDPIAKEKLAKRVLVGLSIGGKYVEKSDDGVYVADPSEVSVVDNPCVENAMITVVKADGSEEIGKAVGYNPPQGFLCRAHAFHDRKIDAKNCVMEFDEHDGVEKIARRSDSSPKEGESKYGDVEYADPTNKKYPIDTAAHIRAAWNYINQEKNASKYSASDVAAIKKRIIAAWKDKIDKDGPPSASSKAELSEDLKKSLYSVAQLAYAIVSVQQIAADLDREADSEQDALDSEHADQIEESIQSLYETLVAMAQHESDEYSEDDEDDSQQPAYASAAAMYAVLGEAIQKRSNPQLNEVIKSLHVHTGNESKQQNKSIKEEIMEKEKKGANADAANATEGDLAKSLGDLTKSIKAMHDDLKKDRERVDAIETKVNEVTKSVSDSRTEIQNDLTELSGALAKTLAFVTGVKVEEDADLDTVFKAIQGKVKPAKAVARSVAKADDTKSTESDDEQKPKKTGNPLVDDAKLVASF